MEPIATYRRCLHTRTVTNGAEDLKLGETVALKIVPTEFTRDGRSKCALTRPTDRQPDASLRGAPPVSH